METITYSLRDGQEDSASYYHAIATFTDEVLSEAESHLGALLDALRLHLEGTPNESPRTRPEYVLDLLVLGVLWRVYAGEGLGLAEAPRQMLTGLSRLRQRGGGLKLVADLMRGVLGRLFLAPAVRRPAQAPPSPSLAHLDRLVSWLAATGTFEEEVNRLAFWRGLLASRPAAEQNAALVACADLAGWFQDRSEVILGRYTRHVERFLAEVHPRYRWREDNIFCGRRRVEYHLNMVATEILNQAFREAFLATARKLVLLPPCMKARPEHLCQAKPTPFGARCAGCTPSCHIHQVTKLGEKHGFGTLILPDELSVFSSGRVEPIDDKDVGIIGVSCVLTNASGGWETQALGIPAQGVLLDYCGCSWHWHRLGIPTDIDIGQLLRVLGVGQQTPVV